MRPSHRPILLLVAAFPIFMILSALMYKFGMSTLEGQPRTFLESLEWASETLTTTGYGKDAHWKNPIMILFVIGTQVVGLSMVYLIVPLFLLPMLENRFQTKLPTSVEPSLSNHVIIYRYGQPVYSLVAELEEAGIPTVVVESDESLARKIFDRKWRVVFGDLEDNTLHGANIQQAKALIANGSDDDNAALTLTARRMGFSGDILALIAESMHRNPLMLAGASACYLTEHLLGAAIAVRASGRLGPRIAGIHRIGRKLEVAEVRINPGCVLDGKTLGEANIGFKTGVTVIAQWVSGTLQVPPTASMILQPKGILVCVGTKNCLAAVADLMVGGEALPSSGPFIINGNGKVANKVEELLCAVGEDVLRIDWGEDASGILSRRQLDDVDASKAQAVILALDNDSTTLFDTVVIKDYLPHVPVLASLHNAENQGRVYQAGAEFALSISEVAGQVLARKLLGEESFAIGPVLKLKRLKPGKMLGKNPIQLDLRQQTACSVVAVERGDEVILNYKGDFRFEADDQLYVCGDRAAIDKLVKLYAPNEIK